MSRLDGRSVEGVAHGQCEVALAEGFREQLGAGIEAAIVDDVVLAETGHE